LSFDCGLLGSAHLEQAGFERNVLKGDSHWSLAAHIPKSSPKRIAAKKSAGEPAPQGFPFPRDCSESAP
jgi:hypothetical protein